MWKYCTVTRSYSKEVLPEISLKISVILWQFHTSIKYILTTYFCTTYSLPPSFTTKPLLPNTSLYLLIPIVAFLFSLGFLKGPWVGKSTVCLCIGLNWLIMIGMNYPLWHEMPFQSTSCLLIIFVLFSIVLIKHHDDKHIGMKGFVLIIVLFQGNMYI